MNSKQQQQQQQQMMPSSLQRLMKDLRAMQREPLPGIQVHIDPHNFAHMCLLLTPLEGPYRGICLHLSVFIPFDYPRTPPRISIQTLISHPNVFSNSSICCDLLQRRSNFNSRTHHCSPYLGGYTPAYLLHYLFMQLLSFFSSSLIEQNYGNIEDVYSHASLPSTDFHCEKCGFDSARLWSHARAQVCRQPNKRCPWLLTCTDVSGREYMKSAALAAGNDGGDHLNMLQDHIWLIIFEHLSDQDLINLGRAAPWRAGDVLRRFKVPLRRELLCFFTRKTFKEAVLGVGVRLVKVGGKPTLHAEAFDLLSLEAFVNHHVRAGICNEPFTHFLPLALDDDHFARAKPGLTSLLKEVELGGDISNNGYLHVIPKLMNTMIVNMMKTSDAHASTILQASERAFKGYCLLFHLLIKLSETGDLQATAKERLVLFLSDGGEAINKKNFPDLGEFVALLPLALDEGYDWSKLCKALVSELFTRNVRWMLKDNPHVICPPSARMLVHEIFSARKVGLRLMMLQANFMRALVKCRGKLSDRYGFPSDPMAKQLVNLVKKIYILDEQCRDGDSYEAWKGFFTMLNYNPIPSEVELEQMLQKAVQESKRKGYH